MTSTVGEPNVRSGCDQNASLPAHHSVGHDDVIREHGAPVGYSIAVRVLKQHDSPYRSRIQGIPGIFGHINPPVLVPVHRHGAFDHRLGDKELNVEALVNVNRA